MFGSKILSLVISRLEDIIITSLDFCGVSINSVGDFRQLRPVKYYVFQIPNSGSEDYHFLVASSLGEVLIK